MAHRSLLDVTAISTERLRTDTYSNYFWIVTRVEEGRGVAIKQKTYKTVEKHQSNGARIVSNLHDGRVIQNAKRSHKDFPGDVRTSVLAHVDNTDSSSRAEC